MVERGDTSREESLRILSTLTANKRWGGCFGLRGRIDYAAEAQRYGNVGEEACRPKGEWTHLERRTSGNT